MTGRGKKEVLSRDFLLRLVSKIDHVLYGLEEGGWANLLWKILLTLGFLKDFTAFGFQFNVYLVENEWSF